MRSRCCSWARTRPATPRLARVAGWAFAIWGRALYWCAAVLYVEQARRLIAADPRAGGRAARQADATGRDGTAGPGDSAAAVIARDMKGGWQP